jgi:hypothetical protein
MATSGITINQLSRDQYIASAMRKLNVLAKGQTPDAEDLENGTIAFNALIAEFRALGMPLWARATYSFSPTLNDVSYNIGVGQTLNTPYPINMLQAYRLDSGQTTHIPMEIVPDYNFNTFPSSSGGMPIQLTYQPKVNMGVIKLWPTPDASALLSTITIIYQRPTEYVISASDTLDVPEEWTNALIYQLAVRLASEWGISLPDRQMLKKEADDILDLVLENGTEQASLFLQVDSRGIF